jgi:hypothetical protein
MGKLCKTMLLSGGLFLILGDLAFGQTPGSGSGQHTCNMVVNGKTTSWQRITATKKLKLQPVSGKSKLPARYSVYTINDKQLKDFLMAVKKAPDNTIEIALPLSAAEDCKRFALANANTMAPGLAARYPELISLKGFAAEDKNAGLRLDYDGSDLRAEITWGGTIYLLSPWKSGKKKYYLVYKKEDAGIERKQSFRG